MRRPTIRARTAKDMRTTALLSSSVKLLENLGVWPLCRHAAAPLTAIRIVDDRGDLLRAPEVLFQASELGLADFGANIPNAALVAALTAAAEAAPRLRHLPTSAVVRVTPGDTSVRLDLAEGGSVDAALVVAADGRGSLVRAGAGIGVRSWSYPQSAVAAVVSAFARPRGRHHRVASAHGPPDDRAPAWQHVEPGVGRATVGGPAPRCPVRSGVCRCSRASGCKAFSAASAPAAHAWSFLSRATTPTAWAQTATALVGEAAHVIPPIGAQGLNLGLRDASVLAECVADARDRNGDIGAPDVLRSYHQARQADVLARTLAVDALNRSLLADFLPAQALRGAGLHLLANSPSLRRLLMQGGMTPVGALPRLMRSDAPA